MEEYTGIKTLEILQDAVNYNQFIENELLDFIGSELKATDFGAGVGEFANRLRKKGVEITCVENDSSLLENLNNQGFCSYNTIQYNTNRLYSLNVLEHIENDVATLKEIYDKLEVGGKLFLYVPAFMCLYTNFDKHVGHFRRYKINDMQEKLQKAGFRIVRIEYADSLGFICWYVMGKFQKVGDEINPFMVKIFDRIIFPISRLCDLLFKKLFGKNLLVIAVRD